MDKGIRPAAIAKFNELLPTRVNTREGNTAFRKTVMASIMEDFGITLASAATHYNHAFMEAKKDPAKAELLVGLGRPEDKKGGRKKVVKAAAPAAEATTVADVLMSNILQSRTGNEGAAVITDAAAAVGLESLQQEDKPADEAPKEEAAPVQKYSVRKVSDKSIVCSDLTLEEAQALIEKAAAAKKAKLELAD